MNLRGREQGENKARKSGGGEEVYDSGYERGCMVGLESKEASRQLVLLHC